MAKGYITRKMIKKGNIVTGQQSYQSLNDYINDIVVDIYNRFFEPNGFSKSTGFNVRAASSRKTSIFYYIIMGISDNISNYLINLKQAEQQN